MAHGPGRFRIERGYWIAAGLAILAAVLTFDSKLYINGDNVDYMFLGRRVREGDFWPSDKYPPLFPYLLALVQSVFGMALVPQKIAMLACYAVAVCLFAPTFATRRMANGAWIFGIAVTLVPALEYSHYTMSEIPYMLCLAGLLRALTMGQGVREQVAFGARRHWRAVVADAGAALGHRRTWEVAIWLAAAFYLRTAGLALGAAVLLIFWQRGERGRGVSTGVALLVFLLPWLMHTWSTPGGNPYFEQWARVNPYYPNLGTLDAMSLLRRVIANARTYFLNEIPIAVVPVLYRSTWSEPSVLRSFYLWPVALLILAPFLIGMARGLRAAEPPAWIVAVVIVGSCLWPEIWAGTRFMAPIVPLAFLVFWDGMNVALARIRGGRKVRAVLLAALTLLAFRNVTYYYQETRHYPPVWNNYFQAVRWIGAHTPSDAVVIDRKPAMVEYMTERKATSFPRETDPDRMLDAFAARGAEWVILPSLPYDDIPRYLQPALQGRVQWFEPAFVLEEPATYVARFRRADWIASRSDSLAKWDGIPVDQR